MEFSEGIRRIVVRHRLLLLIGVVLPLLLVGLPLERRAPTFAATSRIQGQTSPPSSDTEADAVVNRVHAVASSPAIVAQALSFAHLQLDATDIAEHHIQTARLGSSAVVTLTVTDRNRDVASLLVRNLAPLVVLDLTRLSSEEVAPALAGLDQQRRELTDVRSRLFDQLSKSGAAANGPLLLSQLSSVDGQLSALVTARQQILATGRTGGGSAVVYPGGPATEVPDGATTTVALALIAGVVLALLGASVHEFVRPTVPDAAAFGRHLGAPFLGGLSDSSSSHELSVALRAATRRTRVRTLVLLVTEGRGRASSADGMAADLSRLVPVTASDHADEPGITGAVVPAAVRSEGGPYRNGQSPGTGALVLSDEVALRTAATAVTSPCGADEPVGTPVVPIEALDPLILPEAPGLVIAAGEFAPISSLERVRRIEAATGWPVVGVVELRTKRLRRRPWRSRRRRQARS